MRFAALFCACAASFTAGCATGRCPTQLTPKQQWEALSHRMPVRQLPAVGDAARPLRISRRQETALQDVAVEALDSVVRVKSSTDGLARGGSDSPDVRKVSTHSGGTGIVISSDGLILTNEHVVRHTDRLTVVLPNGTEYAVQAIATHPNLDLAVVRIDRTNLQSIAPAIQTLKVGIPVVAVSCTADRRDHSFRTGVITDTRRSLQRELDPTQRKDYGDLIETTARLAPGFSGGPLLDSMGRLVGLNVAVAGRLGTSQQRSYALPFNDLYREAVAYLVEEVSSE